MTYQEFHNRMIALAVVERNEDQTVAILDLIDEVFDAMVDADLSLWTDQSMPPEINQMAEGHLMEGVL